MKKLSPEYYLTDDVVELAKNLLGKVLCTRVNGILTTGYIIETEAYAGAIDKASHAYGNKRTKRTETMFAKGGCAYVYLIYGMHHLFNVVSNVEGIPHAVLVRGIEAIDGKDEMIKRRGGNSKKGFTRGPGTSSQALGISTMYDKMDLNGDKIWIEDRGIELSPSMIKARPRIGVDYAKEHALWEWNFFINPEDLRFSK